MKQMFFSSEIIPASCKQNSCQLLIRLDAISEQALRCSICRRIRCASLMRYILAELQRAKSASKAPLLRKIGIGESLLTSLFTFFIISIRLTSYKPWPYMSLMRKLKELIKLSNLCNFQVVLKENISHQKLRNCWVAKKLMSHTSPVKFRVFRRKFLWNHSMYWAKILRKTKTVMPFQYSEFLFH